MSEQLDEYGWSDLHYSVRDGDIERVQQLILMGSDINPQDQGGWTPLYFAAQACSAEITESLLCSGAEVDPQDSYGNTPLWRAVFESRGEGSVIIALLNAGADPYLENHAGVSPVTLARRIGNYDVAQFFSNLPDTDSTP